MLLMKTTMPYDISREQWLFSGWNFCTAVPRCPWRNTCRVLRSREPDSVPTQSLRTEWVSSATAIGYSNLLRIGQKDN